MTSPTPQQIRYTSRGGLALQRNVRTLEYANAMDELASELDSRRGVLLASSFEYSGRYTRWDIGFSNPPIEISASGSEICITALNQRGQILLPELYRAVIDEPALAEINLMEAELLLRVVKPTQSIAEEQRSRQPSVFSVLRRIRDHFASDQDGYLGLYGAFGYDLTFQFEDVQRFQSRADDDRDLLLYLPDRILVADHRIERTLCYSYEFICRSTDSERVSETTGGLKRRGSDEPYRAPAEPLSECDHGPGEYAQQVERALEHFHRGDLFEVVPGQTFREACFDTPAEVFKRLKQSNPAPYGALMNLGRQEYLVAASPEMFVRVSGKDIETCPISGTIRRGADPLEDAEQIKRLLNSEKDESELSMCTDVDRNDKTRVCEPGSVRVVGRRQIEMYSRLIHTVDHVKGRLLPAMDALDGFLAHSWAVTVTGAPKLAAMQFIEQFEKSPRHWYGGAMGAIRFSGDLNTGLTLRTLRIKDGVAEIRAGATLLADSDPQAEEAETRLKASALIDAVRGERSGKAASTERGAVAAGKGRRILMVDHQDSFVHTLASYFRECGAEVETFRPEVARAELQRRDFDLLVLSPGPGRPEQFDLAQTIELALKRELPVFGVCLGLQGIVEYFGGSLAQLEAPMHGKSSLVRHRGGPLFEGIEDEFVAGRYHSLVASRLPDCLQMTASSEHELATNLNSIGGTEAAGFDHDSSGENLVMAIAHRELPISAVQFHPESIMSLRGRVGNRLIENLLSSLPAAHT